MGYATTTNSGQSSVKMLITSRPEISIADKKAGKVLVERGVPTAIKNQPRRRYAVDRRPDGGDQTHSSQRR